MPYYSAFMLNNGAYMVWLGMETCGGGMAQNMQLSSGELLINSSMN